MTGTINKKLRYLRSEWNEQELIELCLGVPDLLHQAQG